MLKHFVGLLLVLSAVTASADSAPHWIEVKSPHFTVLTNSSEKDGRRIASQFERMRAVFHILMPTASDDIGSPIMVIALKDKKSFRTLEPEAYLAKNQLDLAGLFLRSQDKNYILLRLDAEGEHPFATVYHEYTHYMLRKAETWLPLWLNEGLAEFYQNARLQEKDVRLGEPSPNDILYLRQNRLLPLTTLLQVDHNSPYYHDEQKGSVFYSESWALTHYLEITDFQNKTSRLQDYAQFLLKHEDPVTAAQHAFGDLKKLQQALDFYVQQSNFQEFQLLAPVPFNEATFVVHPVSESQANAVRAGVLLDVQRTKDAEALLATVLQAEPNNALAHETMGALKLRDHDIPAAKKWYSEAVQLDSQSYLAHFYFAAMSLQDGERDHDDAIEQSLRASIRLNPKFAPAYDALAQFYASRHEKLTEAHTLSLMAVQLEPENLSYRLDSANVLMEDQQFTSALQVLDASRKLAKSIEETGLLERRIAEIESYQATTKHAAPAPSTGDKTVGTVTSITVVDNRTTQPSTQAPAFPTGAPTGPHHTVSGVIRQVRCIYPTVLTLTLDRPGKPISLYTNNYFKLTFTTANFNPTKDLLPCTGIEGLKGKIEYGEVTDPRVAGQMLSVELSK
ncbi:DUF1570 domain-containing protein [Granulicella sp. WH15]|uniref:DUF1570 domain-containing protein n=1 Tax=Granulicella sp. WH15 TaxID=2602070 RepID=UPI0013675CF9|nr:DUF1570 domain-containing protein [Granulicella sp. WH15]QHN04910.1 DUF1570 domain-containing protein [Granulicella sp. WH15]